MPPQDISGKDGALPWTLGPWRLADTDVVADNISGDGTEAMIAGVYAGGYTRNGAADRKRLLANARLIAAAPAMADALDGLLKLWDSFTENGEGWGNHEEAYHAFAKGRSPAWESARAALSLAHGEQP